MTLQPEGSDLKQAVKWISEQRIEEPSTPVHQLVEKASLLFNLNPKKTEYLLKMF